MKILFVNIKLKSFAAIAITSYTTFFAACVFAEQSLAPQEAQELRGFRGAQDIRGPKESRIAEDLPGPLEPRDAVDRVDLFVPNHSGTYIVRENDTLWSVASQLLQDPMRWPEAWEGAPPDFIYPGDVIVIHFEDGVSYLRIQAQPHAETNNNSGKVLRLHPQIRVLAAKKAIPSLPLSVIGPFLNHSLVLQHNELARAPFVMGIDDDHLLIGQCTRFFAVVCNVKKGDRFSIYRAGQDFICPKSKVCLGKEAVLLGTAQAVQVGCEGYATTFVLQTGNEEIKIGDKLLPYQASELRPCFYPRYPDNKGSGCILSVLGGLNQMGQYQVVAISGGENQRRQVGDVLAIYQTKRDEPTRIVQTQKFRKIFCKNVPDIAFCPQRVGELMVFKTFDKVSFALVTNSLRPIYLQDEVKRP